MKRYYIKGKYVFDDIGVMDNFTYNSIKLGDQFVNQISISNNLKYLSNFIEPINLLNLLCLSVKRKVFLEILRKKLGAGGRELNFN